MSKLSTPEQRNCQSCAESFLAEYTKEFHCSKCWRPSSRRRKRIKWRCYSCSKIAELFDVDSDLDEYDLPGEIEEKKEEIEKKLKDLREKLNQEIEKIKEKLKGWIDLLEQKGTKVVKKGLWWW